MGPTGNDAQQLLGYNNCQRVGKVGFINSGDEEGTAWLHTDKMMVVVRKDNDFASVGLVALENLLEWDIPAGWMFTTRCYLRHVGIYRTGLRDFSGQEQ